MGRRIFSIKLILTLVLGLSLGAVFWFFFQFRENQGALPAVLPKLAAKSVMALSHIQQTATKDGVVQWRLQAAAAELEADSGRMVLQSPKVTFFLEDGGQVHLTAEKGILNTKTNNMEVKGNVHLTNDRYTLVTEELDYQHDLRVISTKTPVQISGQAIHLDAAAMAYDLNTDQTRFSGPVEGILRENPVS